MKTSAFQKIFASTLAVLAIGCVVVGGWKRYEISSDEIQGPPSLPLGQPGFGQPPFGVPPFGQPTVLGPPGAQKEIPLEVSDLQLIVNATFTGVIKRDGVLYWTYDPTEKRGKRACPT